MLNNESPWVLVTFAGVELMEVELSVNLCVGPLNPKKKCCDDYDEKEDLYQP